MFGYRALTFDVSVWELAELLVRILGVLEQHNRISGDHRKESRWKEILVKL
jgi:hypothetical protein